MKGRIRVDGVGPGIFSTEVSVTFDVNGSGYTMLLPRDYVQDDDTIEVEVVAEREGEVLVDLPRETFTSGPRIKMPSAQLLPA